MLVEGDEHARLDGRGDAVEQVVRLAHRQDGLLDVDEAKDGCQKSGDRNRRHELQRKRNEPLKGYSHERLLRRDIALRCDLKFEPHGSQPV